MTTLAFIDQITRWWDALPLAQQIFFGIGMVAGVISLLLAVLAVVGLEHHDMLDATAPDFDHGGGGIFSIKPLTGFFLGFGWAGGIALGAGWGLPAATGTALLAGGVIMGLIVAMLRAILSVRSDGTMRIEDAVGSVATVYLTLPPGRTAGGQIIVNFKGRQETLPALNAGAQPVVSGEKVKVLQVVDSRTLLVERLS